VGGNVADDRRHFVILKRVAVDISPDEFQVGGWHCLFDGDRGPFWQSETAEGGVFRVSVDGEALDRQHGASAAVAKLGREGVPFLRDAGADICRPLAHAGEVVCEEGGGRAVHDIADMQRLGRLHGEGAEEIGVSQIAERLRRALRLQPSMWPAFQKRARKPGAGSNQLHSGVGRVSRQALSASSSV